jgi:hypothetical protein
MAGVSVEFGVIGSTEMACMSPEGVMDQELTYLRQLQESTWAIILGDYLWLWTEDGRALVYTVVVEGYGLGDLMADLASAGLAAELMDQEVDHGFAIKGRLLLVDGIATYAYEFASVEAAENALGGVVVDEYSLTISHMEDDLLVEVHSDWLETPNVFSKGRLIVVTGADEELVEALEGILGAPLAPEEPEEPEETPEPTATPTPEPEPTDTPEPTATPTVGPDCSGPDAFPLEEAELIVPNLTDVWPAWAVAGQMVGVWGNGGYLYWENECGTSWDESARSFDLYFDSVAAGTLVCATNACYSDFKIPLGAHVGAHTISVQGGSALVVQVYVPTATPTATPPGPTATPTPLPTATPTPLPTATPTPLPPPPVITAYWADPAEVNPGQNVWIHWNSTGATWARLSQWRPYGSLKEERVVGVNGGAQFSIGWDQRLFHEFRLTVGNDHGQTAQQSLTVGIRCPFVYFFTKPASWGEDHCPLKPAATTWAAEQRFEHGRMIWLQGLPAESTHDGVAQGQTIYVLYYADSLQNYGEVGIFADTFVDGDPESDPSIVPPAGLQQPVRGFGKVWRNNSAVRSRLGWALESEQGYDAAYQVDWRDPINPVGSRYLRLINGSVVWLGDLNNWGYLIP